MDASRYLFGDPTLDSDQRLVMTYNGLRQRLWFRGYLDPNLASNVDKSALEALVPVDRSQRVYRPVGAGFDNRVQMQLADGIYIKANGVEM